MMPGNPGGIERILDPFLPLREIARTPITPPAVVFWTSAGGVVALPLADAINFFRNTLLDQLPSGGLMGIDSLIRKKASDSRTRRFLHMSDFHFGGAHATAERRRYLKSELALMLDGVHRVIITGDLFDSPNADFRDQFLDFKADVERLTSKPVITIPGNHDVRPMGNYLPGLLKQKYEFLPEIGWQPLIVDDDLRCIFFCFNSMEESELAKGLARGYVSPGQRQRMLTSLNEEIARRLRLGQKDIQSYARIALVHHHPVPYDTMGGPRYQMFVDAIFNDKDKFSRFEGSSDFLTWCSDHGCVAILHGHKHVPYHGLIMSGAENLHPLAIVGCGSTLGAEGRPLCYDIIALDPLSGACNVTFLENSGNKFKERGVVIDRRNW